MRSRARRQLSRRWAGTSRLEKEKADSVFWRRSEILSLGCPRAFWDQGRGPDAFSSVKWFEILTAMLLLSRELLPEGIC